MIALPFDGFPAAFLAVFGGFAASLGVAEDDAMNDKKSTRFSLDELARQLAESVPQNLRVLGQDLERNFKSMLQSGLERMELVTREEFDLQRGVLDRTRAKLEDDGAAARGPREGAVGQVARSARVRARFARSAGGARRTSPQRSRVRLARAAARMSSLARLLSRGQTGLARTS